MSLITGNKTNNNVATGDFVKSVESFQNNECRKELTIQYYKITLTLFMNNNFITILWTTESLLGDTFYGFSNDYALWYGITYEPVANING